jgi:pimeloyl-ACP methyl ester carboxylesterase
VAITADTLKVMDLLTAQGVAVAASSYSDNGWVVKDGAQRTHQLLGIFTSKFGLATRVYAAGGSMGGLIAIKLIETYPGEFAGALLACPVAGGSRAQLDYGANVYALFDLFYPGVLPHIDVDDPQPIDATSQIVLPAIAAMTNDPSGALAIASIDQTPVPFANGLELIESIVTPLAGAAGYAETLELTHGQWPFDNSYTQYTGPCTPARSRRPATRTGWCSAQSRARMVATATAPSPRKGSRPLLRTLCCGTSTGSSQRPEP